MFEIIDKNISGIYCIENLKNNKKYFGQSLNIRKRLFRHRNELRKNKHRNSHLQNSWNKYGEEEFSFKLYLRCDQNDLDKFEKYFVLKFLTQDENFGFNIESGGNKNKIISLSTRLKQSLKRKGVFPSEETKKKMSESSTGRKNHMYGRPTSDETKKLISELLSGDKNPQYNKTGKDSPNFCKKHKNSSSKYIGVSFTKSKNKWRVYIRINKKSKFFGAFETELDAARAYDIYVIENNLKDHSLNFPEEYMDIFEMYKPLRIEEENNVTT